MATSGFEIEFKNSLRILYTTPVNPPVVGPPAQGSILKHTAFIVKYANHRRLEVEGDMGNNQIGQEVEIKSIDPVSNNNIQEYLTCIDVFLAWFQGNVTAGTGQFTVNAVN